MMIRPAQLLSIDHIQTLLSLRDLTVPTGGACRIRTCDLRLRRPTLYPAEPMPPPSLLLASPPTALAPWRHPCNAGRPATQAHTEQRAERVYPDSPG
jgi:hypothetical protein